MQAQRETVQKERPVPSLLDTLLRVNTHSLPMTPRIRKLFTFPIDDDLSEGLREIEERDGVSKAEQIRRGIRMWLELKGVTTKTDRKRAATRKRS